MGAFFLLRRERADVYFTGRLYPQRDERALEEVSEND